MAHAALARTKINTKVTQPAPGQPSRRQARPGKPGRPPKELEKVRERLQADAANMERPGADLIAHYLMISGLTSAGEQPGHGLGG